MKELFLVCSLALPSPHFTHSPMVSYQVVSEEERLIAWIRKNNPGAEVFIHPNPQRDKMHREGFERLPFTWRGNQIWIRRKEISDRRAA